MAVDRAPIQATRANADMMLWECAQCSNLRASNADLEWCDCTDRCPIMICRRRATEKEIAEHGH